MANPLQLQILLNAIDRVSGPLRKVMGGSSATSKALRETQTRLKELDAAQRQISGFRQLHAGVRQTSEEMRAAQARVDALAAEIRKVDAPTRAMTREFDQASRAAAQLKTRHTEQQRQLQAMRGRLEAAGVSTRNLQRHQRELRAESDQVSRALARQKQQLERVAAAQRRMQKMHSAGMTAAGHGAGAVAAGAAGGRAMAAPVMAYAAQEDASAQLRAALMSAEGKLVPEFTKIEALAQRLGNRLPGTTADMYEMITMLSRQGMSAKAILGGLGEATGYLGAQLRMPYTEAAQFAAKLQDATRATEAEMMGLADTIQRTFYLGVDANNMLQGFSKLSPALDTIRMKGLAGARALAPLLVMADQAGMAGEAAGNAYRKVFQYAMDADKVGKANSLLKASGSKVKLDFTDGKGEFGGLDKMFAQLKQLEKLNTQDRLAVIKKLFGDDAETLQVVSLLISKGAVGYAQVQQKMAAQASLQQRVNLQLGTLKNLWDAASGTFVNALATMGETIAPELKQLTEWLGSVAGRLQAWAKENPRLAGTLFKIAAVLVVVVAVAGALAIALGTMLMPFAGLQMALVTAGPLFASLGSGIASIATKVFPLLMTALRAVGAAMLTNPVGLILTGIAVAAYLIYRNWDRIGPWFSALWAGIKGAAATAWEWIKGIFAWTPLGLIISNWDRIGPWFSALWEGIKGAASTAWEWIKGIFAWTPLGLVISNWGAIKQYMAMLWEQVKLYVGGAWDFIRGIFSGDTTLISQGLQKMWHAINTVLGGWPAKMMAMGRDILQGLISGIIANIGALKGAIGKVASKAVGTLKSLLGIHSPSRVFASLGGYTMQGFNAGLQRGERAPLARMQAFGGRLRQAGAGAALAAAAAPVMAGGQVLIDRRAPVAPAAAAPATTVYEIHIHAGAAGSPQDIAQAVRAEVERIEREKAARTRSRFNDYGD
jgi:TP901 family phage tail tape measure protein